MMMGFTEIRVVLLSLTKSVTAPKWTTARLQTPSLQGLWDRSNTQEDKDRSASKKSFNKKKHKEFNDVCSMDMFEIF